MLALDRDVPFHDGEDLDPELVARRFVREEGLVRRIGAGGGGGNPERRGGDLQGLDGILERHRQLRSRPSTMPPWRENGNSHLILDEAPAGAGVGYPFPADGT
jgi:hypothetical protein